MYYDQDNGSHLCYRTTVNVSTGIFTTATQFNAVGYLAEGELWSIGSSSYESSASPVMKASVQYVTRDGKISVSFTPSRLINSPEAGMSTNGGDEDRSEPI